jgi:hypothetical protein
MSKWNRTRSGAIHCALFLSREIGAAGAFHHARDNRRAAGAAMHPRVRQEVSLSLKTNTNAEAITVWRGHRSRVSDEPGRNSKIAAATKDALQLVISLFSSSPEEHALSYLRLG